MADDNNDTILYNEEELNSLHKKERKELQAKIQLLKKSVCKGDKKRKKEITEEIVKLEGDLDKKQSEEMAQLRLSQMSIETPVEKKSNETGENNDETVHNENNEDESKKPSRVSKAQKRRDKKENAEKERNQRIIEQEAINVHGKRNIEIQTIKDKLTERDLIIHEIPSDGHCLYNAIAHQLKVIGDTPTLDLSDLRKKTAIYLRENADSFIPFIDNPDSDEFLSVEQYEKYCDNVAETSAWGGAVELQVLSCVLKCPIEVIQANGAPYIVGNEYEQTRKLTLTYHRHMYQLGAHYNSVTKYLSKVDDS